MLVDFKKVDIESVDGSIETKDLSKILGNVIYNQATSFETNDLGRKIWRDGEVDITDDERIFLRDVIQQSFPAYIVRKSLLDKIE